MCVYAVCVCAFIRVYVCTYVCNRCIVDYLVYLIIDKCIFYNNSPSFLNPANGLEASLALL